MIVKPWHYIFSFFLIMYGLALPTSIAGMEAFAWLIFIACLAFWIKERGIKKFWPPEMIEKSYWIWGYWVAIVLGALLIDNLDTRQRIKMMADGDWILLLYAFAWLFLRYLESLKKALPWFFAIVTVVAVFSIHQTFTGEDLIRGKEMAASHQMGSIWRGKGFFSTTMTYSYSFGMFAGLLWTLIVRGEFKGSKWEKPLWIFASLISVSLILTFTRGLWMAMVGGLGVLLLLTSKKWAIRLGILGVTLVGAAYATQPVFRDRVNSFTDFSNYSNQGRIQVWRANWEMLKDNPIIGVGHRLNSDNLPEYYAKIGIENGFLGHAHNNWVQVAGGTGILGLVFYIGFTILFLRLAWRLYQDSNVRWVQSLGLASLVSQIIFHIGGITQLNFMDAEVNHVYISIVALTVALNYSQSKPEASSV